MPEKLRKKPIAAGIAKIVVIKTGIAVKDIKLV
jgi:hypothetical protein